MTAPTITAGRVTDARQRWLAAARAVGGHPKTCIYCQHRHGCSELVMLEVAARDAWAVYEQVGALEAGRGALSPPSGSRGGSVCGLDGICSWRSRARWS